MRALLEEKGETSVRPGDIEGDGDLDINVAKGCHGPLRDLIPRNDGNGHFTTETFSKTPDRTYSAAVPT